MSYDEPTDDPEEMRRAWENSPQRPAIIGPRIVISTEIWANVDDAVKHLARDPEIFVRDAELVQVVRVDGAEKRALLSSGTPIIRVLKRPTLKERLSKFMTFVTKDERSNTFKRSSPPGDVVDAVSARGEWPGFRPLTGIIETPSMRPDGSLLTEPGYDAATGYLYLPSAEYLDVPERPTQDDARRAFQELAEVFVDFPYSSPAARLVPLANILTLVARPSIQGACPAFIYDATTPGSGKTLQTDVIAIIATGRGAARMSWPPDEIELEKVLAAYAIRGPAAIAFDNVTRPFAGGPLDKVLTAADRVELRVLGQSEIPSLRWRTVIMASGNNVQIPGDTARRVLVSRIEPTEERPQDRDPGAFRHPDLPAYVAANRERLVHAALVMLRAWHEAGRPELVPGTWGSFEAWCAVVPQVLAFAAPEPQSDAATSTSVLDARLSPDEAAMADPLMGALPIIMTAIGRLDPDGQGLTLRSLVGTLYPGDRRAGPPDGFDDARGALEELAHTKPGQVPDSSKLGYAFRRARGRWVGGKQLINQAGRAKTILWLVKGWG